MSEKSAACAAKLPAAQLHSRYNPKAEAARYIDSLNLSENIKVFILIEPGLGYIIPALQEKFKESKILVLHAENIQSEAESGLQVLCSTDANEIQKFLETHVPEIDAKYIRIIEWRPSMNFYKEAYVKILSQTAEFLKRSDAGKRTTSAFGKRWMRNFFKNIELINKTLLYKETEIPVIITGSSPCLEKALPVIKKAQDSCLIIAASSSVQALYSYGIKADIIITTDGTSWALLHLHTCCRKENAHAALAAHAASAAPTASVEAVPLAANLCAAIPSQFNDTPFLIINDGSYWQSIILHELSLPSVIIPQKGTVTAAALELAMTISKGNIYLAGMDFSVDDIRTHVKPYSFDALFFSSANRFRPFYAESFTRSFLIHHGGSMNIYASWFKKELSTWPKRIFSIEDSSIFTKAEPPEALQEAPLKNTGKKNTCVIFQAAPVKKDFYSADKTIEKAVNALLNALNNPEYAQYLEKELTSLLLSDSTGVNVKEELEKAIKEIAHLKERALKKVFYE